MEYTGPVVEKMTIDDRMVLCNMAIEMGAKAGVCMVDETTRSWLKERGITEYEEIRPDPDASYEKIITEKNALVPMKDGVKLAIDIHKPDGAGPCPVLLSVYPYHKDGMVGSGNLNQISYFAKRGYVFVMADCRGTGNSGGTSTDPLDGLNGDDLYELVEWIAAQPWCDGQIGMTGMS